jgi:hypothetical protein
MHRRRVLANGLAVLGGLTLAQTASTTAADERLVDNEDGEVRTVNGLPRLQFSFRNSHEQTAIVDEVTIDLEVDSREVAVITGYENAIDDSLELRPENGEGAIGYYLGSIRSTEPVSLRDGGKQATVEPGHDLIGNIGYFWDASGDIVSLSSSTLSGTIALAYQLPDSTQPGSKEATVRLANVAIETPDEEDVPPEGMGENVQLHDGGSSFPGGSITIQGAGDDCRPGSCDFRVM